MNIEKWEFVLSGYIEGPILVQKIQVNLLQIVASVDNWIQITFEFHAKSNSDNL